MKILLFTASKHRALFSRLCVLQMQNQTATHTHCVFLNTEHPDEPTLNYSPLLEDIHIKPGNTVHLAFGRSGNQHQNHITAIGLEPDWEKHDLFLKIDDDDIYKKNYIENIIESQSNYKWDFSGTRAESHINGIHHYEKVVTDLGLDEKDIALNVPRFMPGTFAFSRKAIRKIMTIPSIQGWEDSAWRKLMVADPEIKVHERKSSHYIYNIHGKNVSTAHHYKHNS